MRPTTRSHAVTAPTDHGNDTKGLIVHDDLVEVHLSQAIKGVRELQKELASVRKRNAELEERLNTFEQAEDVSLQPKRGRKGGPTVAKLQVEVRKLNGRIRELEKARQKDKKKIDKLRLREVKRDAAELEDAVEFEVGDSAYRMRKLLRHFHDTMVSSSIEENEECPICMDKLEVNKGTSLSCEHTFCDSCISQISHGSDVIICPQCRAKCPRDDIEVVQFTASQQWDALLEVAKVWAKMDTRREADTSEEEAEEEFIDDEQPEAGSSSSRSASTHPLATSPEPEPEDGAQPEHSEAITEPNIVAAAPSGSGSKRHVAFSPDSSPLSEQLDPDQSILPSAILPENSLQVNANTVEQANEEPVAGPSSNETPPRRDTSPQPATPRQSLAPSYTASPVSEKRKRLESLAAARKRKR